QPALPEAAARLVERYQNGNDLDLGRVIVVVPGSRAGRRLQELLVDEAEKKGLLLTPPSVVTESHLPEELYVSPQKFAPPLVRKLAWADAVRLLTPSIRDAIVPHPPKDSERLRWFRLGEMLARVHSELAADGLNVQSVLREAQTLPGFSDGARWEAVQAAQV